MSGYFSASTNWQGVSHNEPLSWTSSASRVYAGKRLLKWRNPIRSVTWRLWQVTHGLTIWFGKDCETIWLMMVFCAENILAARRTTLLDGESHPIPDVLFSSVYKQRRLIKPNPSPTTSQLHCILFTWKIAGDGVGPEAPQFAQTSLKYLHLDHPLRRACIRSTFFFVFHHPNSSLPGSSWIPILSGWRWPWSWSTALPWGCTSPAKIQDSATGNVRYWRWNWKL